MNARFALRNKFGLQAAATFFVATAMSIGMTLADDAEPKQIRTATAETNPAKLVSPGDIAATPEMWFYEQALQRYNDPKVAVRANAEFKANQRRARLAAMDWYGYSNTRPAAGIDVNHGPLQTQWTGNGANASWWVAPRPSIIWAVPGAPAGY